MITSSCRSRTCGSRSNTWTCGIRCASAWSTSRTCTFRGASCGTCATCYGGDESESDEDDSKPCFTIHLEKKKRSLKKQSSCYQRTGSSNKWNGGILHRIFIFHRQLKSPRIANMIHYVTTFCLLLKGLLFGFGLLWL